MKVVCSWCTRTIREGDESGPISHGICSGCKPKLMEDLPDDIPDDRPEDIEPDLTRELQ